MSTTTEAKPKFRAAVLNLPNQLTIARVVLSIGLFVAVALGWYKVAFTAFVLAASTDWLDGYFARKYGMVTVLGRILDPFADKLIICGTYIFLATIDDSGITAAMAVIVMGRELLVTALRSFLESSGTDFSADMSGKVKMVLQCLAAGMSLYFLAFRPAWPATLLLATSWAAVAATIYSGVVYIRRAVTIYDQ